MCAFMCVYLLFCKVEEEPEPEEEEESEEYEEGTKVEQPSEPPETSIGLVTLTLRNIILTLTIIQ
jgi:hypothetical protein